MSDLREFTAEIGRHLDCLVFPYWFGQKSRSRHGFVPAICEANGVRFVGADAFTKIVCNDKELSKTICQQSGLTVPLSAVLDRPADKEQMRHLRFPVIVKPNYEGTSLGISEKSLCTTWTQVENVSREISARLGQPILVEEFVEGREFTACLMSGNEGVDVKISSWSINKDSDYLNNRIFTSDLKVGGLAEMALENCIDLFSEDAIRSMLYCYERLGKVDLLRIDGRIRETGCVIVELTPDIYLGRDGEFAVSYLSKFGTYSKFISKIVEHATGPDITKRTTLNWPRATLGAYTAR